MSSINTSCRSICLAVLFFATSLGALAQTTIWEEDFYSNWYDSDNSGTGTGFSPVDWSSGNDVIITNNRIEARNVDNGYWRTAAINITGFTDLLWEFDTDSDYIGNSDR